MIALSTCWVPEGVSSLGELFEAGVELGFRQFELGVIRPEDGIRFSLEEVLRAREELDIEIVSAHNVASELPIDEKNMRGDFIASLDEERRRIGVRDALETARNCRAAGGGAVVIHSGFVKGIKFPEILERQQRVSREIESGGLTPEARDEIAKMYEWRNASAAPHLEAAVRSLKEIAAAAPDVKFGLEPRYFFNEIPSIDEMQILFDGIDAPNVYYWHDVGHCQMSEFFGLCRHEEWLERYGGRLLGIHLHDMTGAHDHRRVGSGEIDFRMVGKYIMPDTIKVLEFGKVSRQDIVDSVKFLHDLGIN
jgi:sugar phosphate isomerase/epimerase